MVVAKKIKWIGWMKKRTNKGILDELQTRYEVHAQIIKIKMAFFRHACSNNRCNLVKACILGMMPEKKNRTPPYIDNFTTWITASLEEKLSVAEYRTAWRKIRCAAGAANVRTEDAGESKSRISQEHSQAVGQRDVITDLVSRKTIASYG